MEGWRGGVGGGMEGVGGGVEGWRGASTSLRPNLSLRINIHY